MFHRRIVPIALCALALALSAPAAGQDPEWQPLGPGAAWEYVNATGAAWTVAVEGPAEIRGRATTVLLEHIADGTQVVRNFWSKDLAGNVYLHGARNEDGFAADYEPPIRWVAASLSLGRTWSGVFDLHWLGGSVDPGNAYTYQVYQEEDLTTPAGPFHSFGIGWVLDGEPKIAAPAGVYSVTGVRLMPGRAAARSGETSRWYSDGVGQPRVFLVPADPYDLVAFTGPVPAATDTWGAVKLLYRD